MINRIIVHLLVALPLYLSAEPCTLITLLGPVGAGKSTQAKALSEYTGLPHVSAGEVLRREVAKGTPLGKCIQGYMIRGEFVPDDVIWEVFDPYLKAPGAILDGFPRTESLVTRLLPRLAEDDVHFLAVHISLPAEESMRRCLARGRSGADRAGVIEHRIEYERIHLEPVLQQFEEMNVLVEVDGTMSVRSMENVLRDILTRNLETLCLNH